MEKEYNSAMIDLSDLKRRTASTRAEAGEIRDAYKALSERFRGLGDYKDANMHWNECHERYREYFRREERPGQVWLILAVVLAVISFSVMILTEYLTAEPDMVTTAVIGVIFAGLFVVVLVSDRYEKPIRKRLALIVSVIWNGLGFFAVTFDYFGQNTSPYLGTLELFLAYTVFLSGIGSCVLAMIFSGLKGEG